MKNTYVEIIQFAIPIIVAAAAPLVAIHITYKQNKKETRYKYNEKRLHDFLLYCADYISLAKLLMHVYDDDPDGQFTAHIEKSRTTEAKLRVLSYFSINSDMRKRLDNLTDRLAEEAVLCSRASYETKLCQDKFGSHDSRTHQKKDIALELADNVQTNLIRLETLFLERDKQLSDEWLESK